MNNQHKRHWHAIEPGEVLQLLEVDLAAGLSTTEVERRQRIFGQNRVSSRRGVSSWRAFLNQFTQPLMYILVIAGGITLAMGEWVDGGVILGVVLINGMVGWVQEEKASRAIQALSSMVITNAKVRRDGREQVVNSVELVPGDVVLMHSGDKVPADLRLVSTRNLQIDESMLTGESLPVQKKTEQLRPDTILAERHNLAYGGTLVSHGQGIGVVWATGDRTETGRIAQLMDEATDLATPLTRKIRQFSKVMLRVILGFAAVTFCLAAWRGQGLFEAFIAVVALAVGAIPEGLPAAVTITLAIGVQRMARRRAVVRKLPAVETLGSTTVICSDKTGTLTQNEMTVQEVFAGGEHYLVSGIGYEAKGELRAGNRPIALEAALALEECLRAGVLNNDAEIVEEKGRLVVQGDPTEAALLVSAQKAGLSRKEVCDGHPRLDVLPFESEHQFMATLHHHSRSGGRVIYKKGAVERVLERCSHVLLNDGQLAPIHRDDVRRVADDMAARGMRVLAFARRGAHPGQSSIGHEDVRGSLEFLGLQGMIDPPREEAIAAVRSCHAAGMRVKMITGDHRLTAVAIAEQIALGGEEEIRSCTGRDLEKLEEEELSEFTAKTHVFARVAPEQKLGLVKALQRRGEIVAMTGDGVNDAPALKQADIGIAMGITGTEVAKSAADMILTDDNFASIEAAVEEGRGVFDNLSKFIVWTIPTNAAEAALLSTAILLGTVLPLLPVQLLWINLGTAVFLGLMLVFEPKERDLMKRPPRDPKTPILTYELFMRSGLVTLLTLVGAYGLFEWEQAVQGASLQAARTTVVNVIILVESFYLLNCRSLLKSPWSIGWFLNPMAFMGIALMMLVQWAFTHTAVMNRLFGSAPLSAGAWGRALLVGIAVFAVVELEKSLRRRNAGRRQRAKPENAQAGVDKRGLSRHCQGDAR